MVRSAHRRAHSPVIFECSCGVTHASPDLQIPVGWSTRHGLVWCTDCTRAGIPQRQLQSGGHPRRSRRAA